MRFDVSDWSIIGYGTYNISLRSLIPISIDSESEARPLVLKFPLYGRKQEAAIVAKIKALATLPDTERRPAERLILLDIAELPVIDARRYRRATNSSARAVRIWNQIHELPLMALQVEQFWICPYIPSKRFPEDEEILQVILELYQEHGRIAYDLIRGGNLLVWDKGGEEEALVTVDVDMLCRPGSPISDANLDNAEEVLPFINYFFTVENRLLSTTITKTLFLLSQEFSPEELRPAEMSRTVFAILAPLVLEFYPLNRSDLERIKQIANLVDQECQLYPPPIVSSMINPYVLGLLAKEEPIDRRALEQAIVQSIYSFEQYPHGLEDFDYLLRWLLLRFGRSKINDIGPEGYTLLHLAVLHQNSSAVEYLLQDPLLDKALPSSLQTRQGRPRYAAMNAYDLAFGLMKSRAIPKLLQAANMQYSPSIQALLEVDKAKLARTAAFSRASGERNTLNPFLRGIRERVETEDIASLIQQYKPYLAWTYNREALLFSLIKGMPLDYPVESLRAIPDWRLISKISDVTTGDSLLHLACTMGHLPLCAILDDVAVDSRSLDRTTPLMIAAKEGNLNLVHWLLVRGANPDLQDYEGNTAMHQAVIFGHEAIFTALLAAGARLNGINGEGQNPEQAWEARKLASRNLVLALGWQIHFALGLCSDDLGPKSLVMVERLDLFSAAHCQYLVYHYKAVDRERSPLQLFLAKKPFAANELAAVKKLRQHANWNWLASRPSFFDRETLAHLAARLGNSILLELLPESILNAPDIYGRRPLDLAIKYGNQDCIVFLESKQDAAVVNWRFFKPEPAVASSSREAAQRAAL